MNYKEKVWLAIIGFILLLMLSPIIVILPSTLFLVVLYKVVVSLKEFISSNIELTLCIFYLITFINLYLMFIYSIFKIENNKKRVKNERNNKSRKY